MDSILAGAALFQGVEATAVSDLVERLSPIDVSRGHVFFREGDQGDGMFLIISGKVKIGGHSRDGREGMFTLRGPSESFGDLSVFDPGPRTSTAMALNDVRAALVGGVLLRAWIAGHPGVAGRLLRVFARRLRRTDDNLSDLIFTDVSGRLAKQLLHLAQRFGVQEDGALRLTHDLTQEELAHLVGSWRETVNKALSDFSAAGSASTARAWSSPNRSTLPDAHGDRSRRPLHPRDGAARNPSSPSGVDLGVTSTPGYGDPPGRTPADLAERLLDIKRIYHEPDIERFPRARQVLDRFAGAELIEVPSHQSIPGLYGNEGNVEDWVRIKREVLVLGEKKSLSARRNERSSDWIAPSTANGCAMACSYCYVPRRKGYANPITVFANIEKIAGYLERHAARQGPKPEANQCDPVDWVYDIGENSDCSADAMVSDNVRDLVELFARIPNAKASFATKLVNRELLTYHPRGGTRVRFSLMPGDTSRRVDIRTSKVADRIAVLDDFVDAGYEVHLNLSPVIVHEDWLSDWSELLEQIADGTNERTRRQLAAEIIFLTHNESLHEVNLGWHPQGEELLWRPDLQQLKRSQNGQLNVRYKTGWKGRWVQQLTDLVAVKLPDCRIRYAF